MRYPRFFCFMLVLILALSLALSCGKSDNKKSDQGEATEQSANHDMQDDESEAISSQSDESDADKSAENLGDAMKQLGQALSQVNNGEAIEPVDFRQLKELLPSSVGGLKRTKASGEKTSAMGVKASHARGEYQNDDGANIDIEITDMGNMKGIAALATQSWLAVEIDNESDNGYEKTTKINGYKAFESWNGNDQSGEIEIIVKERFIVKISGYSVPMDKIKSAANGVDLNQLAGMVK